MAENSNSNTPQSDDRNLVSSAEATEAGPDMEERLMTFLQAYKGAIIITIAAIFVLVGITQFSKWQTSEALAKLTLAYNTADTEEQKRAFVATHAGSPLSGQILIELADEAYAANDYESAKLDYGQAALLIENSFAKSRAKLGSIISDLKAGNADAAQTALQSFAASESYSPIHKAESLYHLASIAKSSGNPEKAHGYLDQLAEYGTEAGSWTSMGVNLSTILPQRADAAE